MRFSFSSPKTGFHRIATRLRRRSKRMQEGDELAFFLDAQIQRSDFAVEVWVGPAAGSVEINYRVERRQTAVVHVWRRVRDVP